MRSYESSECSVRHVQSEFTGAHIDIRSARSQSAILTDPQDAALADGHLPGIVLSVRNINRAVRIVSIGLVWCANDERVGARQHIGVCYGQHAAIVRMATQPEGCDRSAGGGECRASECTVAVVRAEPGFHIGSHGKDLSGNVRLKVEESADGDRHPARLVRLIIGNQDVVPSGGRYATRSREAVKHNFAASAIPRAEGNVGWSVHTSIL